VRHLSEGFFMSSSHRQKLQSGPEAPRAAGLRPWGVPLSSLFLLAGLVSSALVAFLPTASGGFLPNLGSLLIFPALLAAGIAAWLRLSGAARPAGLQCLSDFDERVRTAGLLAGAALVPLVPLLVGVGWMGDAAGSGVGIGAGRLLLGVLVSVALGGAMLVLLPTRWRQVALSLLVLLHFGAILVAVVLLPPPGPKAEAPWLAREATADFYRPYHHLLYLGNAYHFYAPDPPDYTELLWFYIVYKDGSSRWVRVPGRNQGASSVEFHRDESLAFYVHRVSPAPPTALVAKRRIDAGKDAVRPIPTHPGLPLAEQYQLPAPVLSPLPFLSSYARHVARSYPSETNPEAEVLGVKIYRVQHHLMEPQEWLLTKSPHDPTLYRPYYQGEYNTRGELTTPLEDAFLWWLIPVLGVTEDGKLVPLEYHAADRP
jgi:hypothetical protein